jgi:exopolysaccharide production protein ExoZ
MTEDMERHSPRRAPNASAVGHLSVPPTNRIDIVQALRGIAALAVVVLHVLMVTVFADREGPPYGLWLMASAVDVFFIVSGFVMVVSAANRRPTVREFLWARVLRIVPLYWLAMALYLPIIAGLGQGLPPWHEALRSYLFIPYVRSGSGLPYPMLGIGWTLNYEMMFYLVFGATLLLGRRLQVLAIAVFFAGLVASRAVLTDLDAASLRLTSPLLFEFVGGMVLGLWLPRLSRAPLALGLAMIAAAVAVAAAGFFVDVKVPRFVQFGGPAFLLVAGCLVVQRHLVVPRLLMVLGAASYSLYLFHIIAVDAVLLVVPRGSVRDPVLVPVLIVISLIAGFAAHRWFERPLLAHNARKHRAARQPIVSPAVPAAVQVGN